MIPSIFHGVDSIINVIVDFQCVFICPLSLYCFASNGALTLGRGAPYRDDAQMSLLPSTQLDLHSYCSRRNLS